MKEIPATAARPGPVASPAHTFGLLIGLLVLSVWGSARSPISEWPQTLAAPNARLFLYLQITVLQWLWVGYVIVGMRRSGSSFRALIDRSRWSLRSLSRYLVVAIAGLIAWLVLARVLSAVFRPSAGQLAGLQAMLPRTALEIAAWVAFALSAGLCEEVVYRGYLFSQCLAGTRSSLAAVVIQAAVYALAHLALPMEMIIPIFLLGLLLGGLAMWQKSLLPGMMLHGGVGLLAVLGSARA